MYEFFVAVLGFSSVASPVLMLRAIASRSWGLMWFAAVASYIVSILGMFSIGAFVFLLTSVQLAAIIAIRCHFKPWQAAVSIFLGFVLWVLLVPVQIAGYRWFGGIGAYQIAGMLGLFLTPLPWPTRPSPTSVRWHLPWRSRSSPAG